MKRIAMFLAAAMAAFGAWADTWTDTDMGYTQTYRIYGDTAEIYKEEFYYDEWGCEVFLGSGCAISPCPTGAVTIPATLGGKPVTSIGSHAFYECSGLTSVTIPDGVTSIGGWAFSDCSGLTNVTFLGNAPMMCDDVFLGISSCTASVSPKSTGWCVGAGEDWNGLTLQYWPEILTELASDAEVVEVMDKFADRRLAVQVTDKAGYDVFRAWVNGNNLYQPNVVESTRTWLS